MGQACDVPSHLGTGENSPSYSHAISFPWQTFTTHYAFSIMVKLSGRFALFESVNGSFPPPQTELCYTNAFQHSPLSSVPCELVTDQPGFRQSPIDGSLFQAKALVLQAGLVYGQQMPAVPCRIHPSRCECPLLVCINHQPCKLYYCLPCVLSIKQQIMTNLRSPGTHLLATQPNRDVTTLSGFGSPLP